jgi:hypothetical protein
MEPRDFLTEEELKMLLSNDTEHNAHNENAERSQPLLPRSSKHKKKESFWTQLFKRTNKPR